jgi:dUTP pyrophosphatase
MPVCLLEKLMTTDHVQRPTIDQSPVLLHWLIEERDLSLPAYHSALAAGMDVQAAVSGPLTIPPGGIVLIPTGFAVALEPGYELQVRPRSGLAIKHGVTVVNAPGTIDADYRGEIKIGLINLGPSPYTINRADRIAQMVLAPVSQATICVVAALPASQRQEGGFGHTGI